SRGLVAEAAAGRPYPFFWILFRVAAYAASAQHTLRVRPVPSGGRLLDRRSLPIEPGPFLAEGAAAARIRGKGGAILQRSDQLRRGPGNWIARREPPPRGIWIEL